MPSGWRSARLGELAKVNPEQLGNRTDPNYVLKYLDIAAIEQPGAIGASRTLSFAEAPSRARRRARAGDILVPTVRPYLRNFARVRESLSNLVVSTGYAVIRPRDGVDGRFLYQHVLSDGFVEFLKPRMSGSNYPAVKGDDVEAYPLSVPPLAEQHKIAAILSSVDDAIEKTQAVIDQVQVVKRGLMQALLTRGLPGRHTRFKPLPNWRLGRVASNLKQIPESWDLVSIASVARLESGHTPSRRKPQYWHGNVPWISLHDTVQLDRPEIRNTEQNISELGLKNSSARLLPKGTVVFSRTATIGKSTIMAREMSTTQDFVNYTCGSRLHNRYLMQLLRHMRPEWRRLMAGSTHKTVYMPIFEQLEILLPPVEEQEEIANIVERLESRVETERKVNARLGNLKSALMSVLLTGELRVTPDTEAA